MSIVDLTLGITCTLVGASINSIGLLLQKHDVNRTGIGENANIQAFLKRPLWILGILCQTIILLPFFFLGIALIGVTLAQPLATAGLLVFIGGAIKLLKERLQTREWAGVALLIVALILVTASGIQGDVTMATLTGPDFSTSAIVFFGGTGILAFVGFMLIKNPKKSKNREQPTKGNSGERKQSTRTIQGFAILMGTAYALVSISGQVVTPPLEAMLGTGIDLLGWTLLIVGGIGIVLGTIAGILFAQEAFKRGQAIDIVPISQVIINLLPVIAGTFLFGQIVLYPILLITGMIVLAISTTMLARFGA